MTNFRSGSWRRFWASFFALYAIDAAVVYLVLVGFKYEGPIILWAAILPIGAYVVQALFALYSFLKLMAWFYVAEKDKSTEEMVANFERLEMPVPGAYYIDGDAYLSEAAMEETATAEARFYAATLLGGVVSQRQNGPRTLGLMSTIVIEGAVKQYSRQRIGQTQFLKHGVVD